jgi:hypothetical protein
MLIHKLGSARKLPGREKTWLLPLFVVSAAARVALLLAPFRLVASRLGTHHGNIPLSPLATNGQLELASRIGSLAASVARSTPWQSKCLVQAIMVKTLLDHYDIPYALYLGVAKTNPKASPDGVGSGTALFAHAWVVVGSRVVAGAAGCNDYTVVSVFLSTSLERPLRAGARRTPGIDRPQQAPTLALDR